MREMQAGAVVGPEESMVAGHQVVKLLGVKDWFEWNGRRFDLKILCGILCESMPDVGELEKDANLGCSNVAKLLNTNMWPPLGDYAWVNSILDRHDQIFNRNLEQMRNAKS